MYEIRKKEKEFIFIFHESTSLVVVSFLHSVHENILLFHICHPIIHLLLALYL